MVYVHGELWQAEAAGNSIDTGEKVRVTGMQNFKLFVEKVMEATTRENV